VEKNWWKGSWEDVSAYHLCSIHQAAAVYIVWREGQDGEFHAVVKRLWESEMKKDGKFGTGVKTSTFDDHGDEKLLAAYLDPKNPFNPWDISDSTDMLSRVV